MSDDIVELQQLEEIPAIPRPALYEMIRGCKNPRDMRLMASFVLMANRCSEGLNVTPEDVHKEMSIDVLRVELEEMESRLNRLRTEVDVGESLGREVSGAKDRLGSLFDDYQEMTSLEHRYHHPDEFDIMETTDDIVRRYPQTVVYVVKILTLKRKKKISRVIPILTVDPLAPLFVESVEKDMGENFYEISRQRVWKVFQRAGLFAFYQDQGHHVPKNPLRHLRLSEVSNMLNRAQLYRYAGWKLKGTQDKYVHLKWDDFVEPLLRVARRAPPFS